MSFPAAPSNGQYTVVNSITYQFDSAKQAWVRVIASANSITANNITVTNSLTGNLVYASGYYFANGAPFTSSNYGNANVAAYLDPYFIYANANAAAQTAAFTTLDANIGAFELYANTTFTSYSNTNVAAYLPTYSGNLNPGNVSATGYYFANGMPFVSGSTYSNVNVAAYITGNISTGNIAAAGYYFSNGAPFVSSTYGNTEVAAYLPTYSGNLNPGNITATGNIVGGGVRTTTGPTEPANPVPGDMWYDTANDVLFRYTDLGTGKYWLDIAGETTVYLSSGNVTFGNVAADGYYFANGAPFVSSLYSNTNVAAYLTSNITTGNISANGYYFANGAPFVSSVYSNTNVTAYLAGNISAGNISTDGYYFANGAPFVSSVYSNTNVTAYLAGNISAGNISTDGYYFANGAPFVSITYSNTNVAAYLVGNITTGNVAAAGYYFANGAPFTSSNYGNANVAAYLPTYTGNLNPNNITASGNIVGGGVRNTTGSTPPANPVTGDTWYDTDNDVLLRYIDDGDSKQWIDISGVVVASLGGGYRYTIDSVPPTLATPGDNWYDTTTDILFRYVTDGTYSFWVDNSSIGIELQSYGDSNVAAYLTGNVTAGNVAATGYYFANGAPFTSSNYSNVNVAGYLAGNITSGNITVNGQLSTTGKVYVSNDIIPTTSNTINIGSNTNRFGSLFLSGNTIYLGNAVITENTQLGTITFIPPATITNPNPTAVIFTSNGGITAVQTIGGNVTANTITPTFANLTATSIYSDSYFYANGTAFVGGGGTNTSSNGISVGYSFSGNSTNTTETELFVDGVNNSRYTVPSNSTVGYEIDIVGRKSDGTAHAYYKLNGLVANISGNVSDVGSIAETIFVRTYSDWLVDARADNTNKTLNIYVQGSTSNVVSWSATMNTTKAS